MHWILGAAVLIHAIGLFAVVFGAHQTHFGNYLFLVIGMPNAQAIFIEKITVTVFLITTFAAVFRPRAYLLLPVFAYVFFEAYAGYYQGGYRFSDWTMITHALRYAAPLGLLLLFLPAARIFKHHHQLLASGWLLRAGLFAVFFGHGMLSIMGNPQFIDLLIGTTWNLLEVRVTEAFAVQILLVIGVVDIAVATALLIRPWTSLLWWMAFWGLLTAFSRLTTLGLGAYFEVMLRASHILAPLFLLKINKQWRAVASQTSKEIPAVGDLLQRGLRYVKSR